ncbi:MAG: long-chain fatty acid--CoA ligase [Alphaproteobacteria bacterium]|jgi:long-chain acyl-CoA synthetase|nr:long-chain fatty acid--CoA ligase [Alphaproteobacteria bacterium]MBT5827944.1 long-chain fatty acid--CoA ligase [Alphaproteobacteria bacterium]
MKLKFSELTTLADLLVYLSWQESNKNFTNFLNNGDWVSHSTKIFLTKTFILAKNLKKLGVKKGDKIAIFSDSSPYWLVCDLACQLVGAISVPMFTNIADENLKYQLQDCQAKYAFVIGSNKWQILKPHVKNFECIITHDFKIRQEKARNLSDLMNSEKHYELNFNQFAKHIKADDIATIIYTSGSTGKPKGVVLTQRNLISQIKDTAKTFTLTKDDVVLSYLPLAHIFERMVMYFYLSKNLSIYFADDVLNVANLLQEVKPTVLTTVPRLLEKIYGKINLKIADAPFAKKIIAVPALWYAKNIAINIAPKIPVKRLFQKLIYNRLLKVMGGNIRLMISGGAALDTDINRFFTNVGLPIMEGYGLTEAAPVIAANAPNAYKFASVGKVFPSVEVKISESGEILAKGPNIMHSYYNDSKATDDVLKNKWLYTGDMGHLDDEGFLFITGRIKELQKTSNGKYVPTIILENKLKQISLADNALVIADGKKFVSAIIFPDYKLVKEQKLNLKALDEYFSAEIDKVNKNFNHWEKIQRFILAKNEATISNGEMTPSMKLRRYKIMENYSKQIEKIYQ